MHDGSEADDGVGRERPVETDRVVAVVEACRAAVRAHPTVDRSSVRRRSATFAETLREEVLDPAGRDDEALVLCCWELLLGLHRCEEPPAPAGSGATPDASGDETDGRAPTAVDEATVSSVARTVESAREAVLRSDGPSDPGSVADLLREVADVAADRNPPVGVVALSCWRLLLSVATPAGPDADDAERAVDGREDPDGGGVR